LAAHLLTRVWLCAPGAAAASVASTGGAAGFALGVGPRGMDDDGGADFTSIQAVVDAASDGDTTRGAGRDECPRMWM
jgi:pectin methylesterase-like acyl-CoA thioesterase